mmetsp:Transcript_6321/g.18146  ORF Transcript_6321/g.18146 Transcript_6321/m.18146 type:complete len:432 (-) Transcript_6321:496-1791(-)|eukprot:CAMPEP_0206137698 /NCGR_PEP_ID=MMETSP1473-20131121/2772_1 /ASSEMBLY_ACC=CAM_ASM_001109 /TAXON_ID=1461547 /ORGANISM="Stichococcus sp, Strain RCC1054" /LENGTH=431 /DNA_ID=CAMNT_0053530899 /DNA_START=264 /DNA_END=1559 /DNA_ORIENTATION=+
MQLGCRVPTSTAVQLGTSGRHHCRVLQKWSLATCRKSPCRESLSEFRLPEPSPVSAVSAGYLGNSYLGQCAPLRAPVLCAAFNSDRWVSSTSNLGIDPSRFHSAEMHSGTTDHLLDALRTFTAMHNPTLSDVCAVQVQLKLAANKAVMDKHHGNNFAKSFLCEDGMAEILKLLHHPDKHIHREAFRFAGALCQQRWVTRELVGRKFVARMVPLMGQQRGHQPLEACSLVRDILTIGHAGGFATDIARQVIEAEGLEQLALVLEANPHAMLPFVAHILHQLTAAGSRFTRSITTSPALYALSSASSAALISGVHKGRAADLEFHSLVAAHEVLCMVTRVAVADGPHATADVVSSGAFGTLVQMQTPWFNSETRHRRQESRSDLRAIAGHHPTEVHAAMRSLRMPFPPSTSPQEYVEWWNNLRTDLGMPSLGV